MPTEEQTDLLALAEALEREAWKWQRRGLLGLADKLQEAASFARGWSRGEDERNS